MLREEVSSDNYDDINGALDNLLRAEHIEAKRIHFFTAPTTQAPVRK